MKKTIHFNLLIKYICTLILCELSIPILSYSQCSQLYNWTNWTEFSGNSAKGSISYNNGLIGVTMSANYAFGSTNAIYNYEAFNKFKGAAPNSRTPSTEWSKGAGGVTTMCFSQTVTNPVLLLSSLGSPNVQVKVQFSRPYQVIYDGGGAIFPNDSTIIGNEGYIVLLFPGDFDYVTIYSSTPEYYTNITWGLNPPIFPIKITGNLVACDSTILSASGGKEYLWSGGLYPKSARNVFKNSENYVLTVTDSNGCQVITSKTIQIQRTSNSTQKVSICEGTKYENYATSGTYTNVFKNANGCDSTSVLVLNILPNARSMLRVNICNGEKYANYAASGTYMDVFKAANGCDSTRILALTVLPKSASNKEISICQGETFEKYTLTGRYMDVFKTANGCDSIRTINLTVNPKYQSMKDITICKGTAYNFNGRMISDEGTYLDGLVSDSGCDSIITLNLKIAQNNFLGHDITSCIANDFILTSPSANTKWFDNTVSKIKKISNTGTYWATILDANGCEISDTIFVKFNLRIFIPNVFSPNNDDINDYFSPHYSSRDFNTFKLSVFDRWGNLMYITSDANDLGWDGKYKGKDCEPGIYVYSLEMETEVCGKSVFKGNVILVK